MSALLEVRSVSKRFRGAGRAALSDISFSLESKEFVTLVGASGSGKTTLLRIIAGLERCDQGEIRLRDEILNQGSAILQPPEQRNMGFVFQNHALFPHLTVSGNVAFGLKKSDGRNQRVLDLLELVGLSELADRFPHELSGGEQQRIALIRALAPRPGLLLMDEPFSSLDKSLRQELRGETRHLIEQQGTTTIMVTHDTEDALAVSDRIVILREGVVEQIGTPSEIYRQPANRSVASSFGACNLLWRADFANPAVREGLRGIEPDAVAGDEFWVRPEDLELSDSDDHFGIAVGIVVENLYHGDSQLVTLECESPDGGMFTVQVRQPGQRGAAIGKRLQIIPALQ